MLPSASADKGVGVSGNNPWHQALEQLEQAARIMNLDPNVHEVLRYPKRALEVAVPVRMEDGTVRTFTGYRVQHNTSRGPSKGGIRYHPGVDVDEVQGAGDVDDLEVRPGGHPLRRRQGRRDRSTRRALSSASSSTSPGATPPRSCR